YLALYGDEGDERAPRFWIAHSYSEAEVRELRERISGGIIGRALATGKTINTASALSDPLYEHYESVKSFEIQAVLCVPLGGVPPVGVLYLQDRIARGPFEEEEQRRVETFARHLLPFVERLWLRRQAMERGDPTQPLRARLKVPRLLGRSQAMAELL